MPCFDDYVICADWVSTHGGGTRPFREPLEPGLLYRWHEYRNLLPQPVGSFEDLSEFRIDRLWSLFENPNNGWSLQLREWEHELFPMPGEVIEVALDNRPVPFAIKDASVTTRYTRRDVDGTLHMEDRTEGTRIVVPMQGREDVLLEWIQRHHDLGKARSRKARSLTDSRNMYRDEVLRLMVRVTGKPDSRRYEMLPSEISL